MQRDGFWRRTIFSLSCKDSVTYTSVLAEIGGTHWLPIHVRTSAQQQERQNLTGIVAAQDQIDTWCTRSVSLVHFKTHLHLQQWAYMNWYRSFVVLSESDRVY